jgi:hypothetical protein
MITINETRNAGYVVRAVMPDSCPLHSPGSWWVAPEDTGRGHDGRRG